MKVFAKMPAGADFPVVGINVSDPDVVCTANIAPSSPHHTLPIYRRFWSQAFSSDSPGWAELVGPNPGWCATQYVDSVRPKIEDMALLLGDSTLDTIVAAALLGMQEKDPAFSSSGIGLAIQAIREAAGIIPWQRGRGLGNYAAGCLAAFCEGPHPLKEKVEIAQDWLVNGIIGRYSEKLKGAGSKRKNLYDHYCSAAMVMTRDIGENDQGAQPTEETLPQPAHFRLCLSYASTGDIEGLMLAGFDSAPVVIAATDRRYAIAVHPGSAVTLDVPRLLDRLSQMEAAALAYEKPREAVMAYMSRQSVGWRVENHRITSSSLLHSDEVMAAVWTCMLGSRKLPAWRAGGQTVKTS